MIFVFLNINEISLQACQKCKLLSYVRNFLLLKAINFTVFRLLSLNSHSSLSVVLVKEKLGHNTSSRWIHNVNKWDMLSCWVVQTFFFLYFFQRKILVLPFKILTAISLNFWKLKELQICSLDKCLFNFDSVWDFLLLHLLPFLFVVFG